MQVDAQTKPISWDRYWFMDELLKLRRVEFEVGVQFIHSFSSLSYDRSKASSKASSPHSAL